MEEVEVDKGYPMIRNGEWVNVFFWYQLTRVVPDQRPLSSCVCSTNDNSGLDLFPLADEQRVLGLGERVSRG